MHFLEANPRLLGIEEHLERANFFFDLARHQSDPKSNFRLMLAAVYACRAIADLMLEAAEKQEVRGLDDPDPKKNRKSLEAHISHSLPFYTLLEHIRIHDFHRCGILPPDPARQEIMLGGPIKLVAKRGGAAVSITTQGVETFTTGNSKVELQRPLLNRDGDFFDEQSSTYVSLDKILATFLVEAPNAISAFAERVRATRT